MPQQLTTASDQYDLRDHNYLELPADLREIAAAAHFLRQGWETLDDLGCNARRAGGVRRQHAHAVRGAEQSAYLAWQAAEMAYRDLQAAILREEHEAAAAAAAAAELPLHRRMENFVLAHPHATIMDLMAEFDLSDDEVRDELEHVRRGDNDEPAPDIDYLVEKKTIDAAAAYHRWGA